jgi:hypothetical protein
MQGIPTASWFFGWEILTDNSKKTVEFAREHGMPLLNLSKASGVPLAQQALLQFIGEYSIKVLNVAYRNRRRDRRSKPLQITCFYGAERLLIVRGSSYCSPVAFLSIS